VKASVPAPFWMLIAWLAGLVTVELALNVKVPPEPPMTSIPASAPTTAFDRFTVPPKA
jgi:hypothetical protein